LTELALDQDQQGADCALCERVVGLGRRGLSRSEIGPAMGMEMGELATLEVADADFARAMRRAAEAARAWWEGLPREALAEPGARFNVGAWRTAMAWRFGAEAAGAGAAEAAAEAAEPERPRVRYYLPENFKERALPDGTPLTPQMRRERAIADVQEFLERAEQRAEHAQAKLAEAEEELAEWREELRDVEARNYDPDAEDDEDWDEDDDGTGDRDRDEDDRIDDDDGDDDVGDDDVGNWHDDDGRGGDGAGYGDGDDAGAGQWLSGGAAGCERAVPARLAGAAAWGSQPDLGSGDSGVAAELRGEPG
jgi:hypothetical protein